MRSPMFKASLSLLLAVCVLASAGCGGAQARRAKHFEKGQQYLAAGNFEKARVEFQNTLQIAPKDAAARYEMGVVDEKLGNPREAAQYYRGVIDVAPDHIGARANLARLYLFAAAPDKALELIEPVFAKSPDNAELLTVRAAIRVQQKDMSGAEQDATRAVQLAPDDENAVAVLSGVYTANGQFDKAQELLERTIKRVATAVDLRLVLVQIYLQQKRPDLGEAQLLEIIKLKPAEKAHRMRLAQFYARAGQIDAAEDALRKGIKDLPKERDLKLALVDLLASRRSREAAEKELRAMIAASPDDNDLKFALAKFYVDGAEPAKAEEVYRGVIDRERTNPAGLVARDRLAALRIQSNDTAGALELIRDVLAKSPRDDDALEMRGSISLAKQDPRSAIADLRAVLRDQPNAVGVLRNLARAHLANGEPAVAEEVMRHAVESNPGNAALRLDFARLLTQLGKADQAKPIITELVKQSPDNVDALDVEFRIAMAVRDVVMGKSAADGLVAVRPKLAAGYVYEGLVAEAEHKPDEALNYYARAADIQGDAMEPIEGEVRVLVNSKRLPEALKRMDDLAARYPENAFVLNLKGNTLSSNARYAEATEAFKQAITRKPKWWAPYRGLAFTQLAQKNPDAAVATLRDAKSIVEQRDALGEELAALLDRVGRQDEAIREYEEVVRSYPKSDVAANNLAMLLATYKSDTASLDRAKELTARFAESANPSFLDTYGWVLFKRGDAKSSVPVLERVVAKVPDAALARYHLGMAQAQAGDDSDARDNLKRAVDSGTQFSGIAEARAALDKLAKLPAATASVPKT